MQIDDLDALAMRPTKWPPTLSGYVLFTEHFAAKADVCKALTSETNFRLAALKAWFGAGYLGALADTLPASSPRPRRPGEQDVASLQELLLWLAPIHQGASDNCDTVDTGNLAHNFRKSAEDAVEGTQFRLAIPVVSQARDGTERRLFPDLFANPLPLTAAAVSETAATARKAILAKAIWLGQRHRHLHLTRPSGVVRKG
ncbi:MAG: hypothetical protein R3D85_09530 [Paracoccaceae bacterium]